MSDGDETIRPFESKADLERKQQIGARLKQTLDAADTVVQDNPPYVDGIMRAEVDVARSEARRFLGQMQHKTLAAMMNDLLQFNSELIRADVATLLRFNAIDPLGLYPDGSKEDQFQFKDEKPE